MSKSKKLTEREKLDRKAAALTAKQRAAIPLFADLIEETTGEDLYWKWRQEKAGGGRFAGSGGLLFIDAAGIGLQWVQIQAIERHAARLLGAEVVAGLAEYARKTYPMPDYGHHVWHGWLTKVETVVFEWTLAFDPKWVTEYNRDGRRVVPLRSYTPKAPAMTREEFDALFPSLGSVQKEFRTASDDPTNLFERTIGALARRSA